MTILDLLQDNKIPLQLAYECGHNDVASYLAKKTADIDPIQINKVLFSKYYTVVDDIPYFIVFAAEDKTRYFGSLFCSICIALYVV